MRLAPVLLATAATATASCLSVMAGWQRGGLLAERALWVAVGVVLAFGAHLIPAMCRSQALRIRLIGSVIWLGCIAATCYGHAIFFLFAQKHAGEVRAAAIPEHVTHGRDLTDIARDRAVVTTKLARSNERRCVEPCPTLRVERITLAAQLGALETEASQAERQQSEYDHAVALRDAAQADPVTYALTSFGVTSGRVDLVAGLAFAFVLEAVACLAWSIALRPAMGVTEAIPGASAFVTSPVTAVTPAPTKAVVTTAPEVAPRSTVATQPPAVAVEDDVIRVTTAVRDGRIRMTQTEIRKFLGCSQSRAAGIRKQATALVERAEEAVEPTAAA